MVYGVGLCDAIARVRVGIALEQALSNAMYRGNLEISADQLLLARDTDVPNSEANLVELRRSQPPYCDRKTHVEVEISRDECRFVVRDEGRGFDVSTMPEPGDPTALEREGGRGLVLMCTFMDEVSFDKNGSEVTLIKRKSAK
ncbi:MAG: ATP-binding protein [Euryarchaeota archaeon]|nr:ATP-binding protein [Euryarchaeota archaeon]